MKSGSSRRVLVVGASKGIGRAVAVAFGGRGDTVVVSYHADADGAAQTALLVEQSGGRSVTICGDVSSAESSADLVNAAVEAVGAFDVIVHCAVDAARGRLLDLDAAAIERAVSSNGEAFLWIAKCGAEHVVEGGSIVFLTSQGARDVVPDYCLIGPPKALAEAFAKYLAVELGARGVRVNIVECGPVDTASLRKAIDGAERVVQAMSARTPMGRGLELEEIGDLVEAVTSPVFAMMTGQRIVVDGGLSLWA